MMEKQTIFNVRVVYKSGYTHDFEVTEFEFSGGHSFTYRALHLNNRPILLGVDEIAAVWQIGVRDQMIDTRDS